jgi:hypothetical protein
MNVRFPLITDAKCQVRVLADRPICLFTKIDELKEIGISFYYIDFTNEEADTLDEIIMSYHSHNGLKEKDFYGHYLAEIE